MFDSVNPYAIPTDAEIVAGYVDGNWAWPADVWHRFTGSKVRISNTPPPDWRNCSTFDRETGALNLPGLRWAVMERNSRWPHSATVYCDRNNLPATQKALRGLHWNLWIADWNGRPTPTDVADLEAELHPGVRLVAWQYQSLADYDLSVVFDADWHRS